MLYIMRHGRTSWNAIRKVQGSTDIPLNDEGRQMAIDAREQYKDIPFDVCYCSPLVRAHETAKLFLEGRDIDIITDERLKEVSFGDYEGMENVYEHPECPIYVFFNNPGEYKAVDNAESIEHLYARTGEFLNEVVNPLLAEGKNVLIVGHGGMNCSLLNQLYNIPVERFWEKMHGNCALIPVEL